MPQVGDTPKNIDVFSERAILGSLFEYGEKALIVADDYGMTNRDFFYGSNADIFFACKQILEKNPNTMPDKETVLLFLRENNKKATLEKIEDNDFLDMLSECHVNFDNLDNFVLSVKKNAIFRTVIDNIEKAKLNVEEMSDTNVPLEDFLITVTRACNGVIEGAANPNKKFLKVGEFYRDYLQELGENPSEYLGIPTGFRTYDYHIGRGLRKGTVNLAAARPGVGKTLFSWNIANYVSSKNIPVLYIDTELSIEQQMGRLSAMRNGIDINDIETGRYYKDEKIKAKIMEDASYVEKMPLYHEYVGGKSFEEILIMMKNWVRQVVGEDKNGKTNECVIIYDYLKMMNSKGLDNLKEFQLIGFYMSSLHDFCVRYNVPLLLLTQLNRDGIDRTGQGTAAQSDRIEWLTSTFAILKNLGEEDMAEDHNMKLVITKSRFGPITPYDAYIKIRGEKRMAKLIDMGLSKQADGYDKVEKEKFEEYMSSKEAKKEPEEKDSGQLMAESPF